MSATPSPPKPDTSSMEEQPTKRRKLHGRAFYESIGSPKVILAPMVDQSEFAWRMLSRSFFPEDQQKSLLAYSPMFHSRLFNEGKKYRDEHFQPIRGSLPSPPDPYHQAQVEGQEQHLDGNEQVDRPLFVQFCSNNPDDFLGAAKHVQGFCDAVDLNLGCPQGIAKRGGYGAFLQEDQDLIVRMIGKLHNELDVPVTAKMRCLETKEKTLAYAQRLLDAGASIITVHGRQREQKGHNTGIADWSKIRYLRESLPPETVIFANGNILQHEDIEVCLQATGADGVMSAEGNLHDPSIFAKPPPVGHEGREYWRGRHGRGGYRVDAVFRRYMDIIYKYVLERPSPERKPLFIYGDSVDATETQSTLNESNKRPASEEPKGQPDNKKRKPGKSNRPQGKQPRETSPNLCAMQAHLFQLLRFLVSENHDVRDALARSRAGDMEAFENVLALTEKAVKRGLIEYEQSATQNGNGFSHDTLKEEVGLPDPDSSAAAVARCKRPWWVCQPYVRPLPKEAIEKGSMSLSKKEKARLEQERENMEAIGLTPGGKIEVAQVPQAVDVEIPKEGVVCG